MTTIDKDSLAHLRQVGLTVWEIKTIGELTKQGGEVAWYPERVKPLTNELIDVLRNKRLVELLHPVGTRIEMVLAPNVARIVAANGVRLRLRLTDEGRAVAVQLDAMMARPKLEVAAG